MTKSVAKEILGGATCWSDSKVRKLLRRVGDHALGRGLYLRVRGDSRETIWAMRFTSPATGRRRWMSLGGYSELTLEDAENEISDCRRQLRAGIDPIDHRVAQISAKSINVARARYTVRQALQDYFDAHQHEWKQGKTKRQWVSLVANNLADVVDMPVAALIDEPRQLEASLRQVAQEKYPTYQKCRKRLNAAFKSAKGRKLIDVNPITDLDRFKRPANAPVKHHNALQWSDAPTFLNKLRRSGSTQVVSMALEFCVLSGARPGEVRHMTWDQVDVGNRVWVIQEHKMKKSDPRANGDHKVPLTDRHLEILSAMTLFKGRHSWVFPGGRGGSKPLSESFWRPVVGKLGYAESVTNDKGEVYNKLSITAHGFRATFKTWAISRTRYAPQVIEAAIAHMEAEMERAYNRSDYWLHRIALAEEYANYCQTGKQPPAEMLR